MEVRQCIRFWQLDNLFEALPLFFVAANALMGSLQGCDRPRVGREGTSPDLLVWSLLPGIGQKSGPLPDGYQWGVLFLDLLTLCVEVWQGF